MLGFSVDGLFEALGVGYYILVYGIGIIALIFGFSLLPFGRTFFLFWQACLPLSPTAERARKDCASFRFMVFSLVNEQYVQDVSRSICQ